MNKCTLCEFTIAQADRLFPPSEHILLKMLYMQLVSYITGKLGKGYVEKEVLYRIRKTENVFVLFIFCLNFI